MTSQQRTQRIAAPPETVFDFVCDIERWPEWDAFADEIVSSSEAPIVAGSTYRERSGRDHSDWTVVEFERPHRQVHLGEVPFLGTVRVEMELRSVGDGETDLHQVVAYEVMPRLRPIGRLIELAYVDRYARDGMRQSQEAAKRLIEGSTARPG